MKSISLCALPFVLTLAAGPPAAFAQPRVCYAVQRGDTASRLAQRITGDARNKYQPWFQIVDASMRSVPQSQYDRIRPGWRACILEERVESRSAPADDDRCREGDDARRGGRQSAACGCGPARDPGRRPLSGMAWRCRGCPVAWLADPRWLLQSPEGRVDRDEAFCPSVSSGSSSDHSSSHTRRSMP